MLTNIEQRRQSIQITLDAEKSMLKRNILGQYATPPNLADDIIEYVKEILPKDSKINFLDPAFGTGSFYSALLKVFPSRRIISATGFEKDERIVLEGEKLWQNTPLKLHLMDFTEAEFPEFEQDKANLIICNPPYVRHHHLSPEYKAKLQSLSRAVAEIQFNGLTGFYCYFLAICHAWMAENGTAGWLVPSEFMDVNYGREIKKYLLNRVTLLRIHRYDPKEVQFNDALVSSSIVWFTKKIPPPDHQIEFTYGGSLKKPELSKFISLSTAATSPKWTTLPFSRTARKSSSKTVRLSELFIVKRGLATGANDFFILSSEDVSAYKLPEKFLTPILPSPKFLQIDEIEQDEKGEPLLTKKSYLLNCDLPESVIKNNYPALWRYLQRGVQMGISERYLCKSRKLWYSQEKRLASPLLCTYMGKNKEDSKPFRFILNHSCATAANVYLMIYPKSTLLYPHTNDQKFIHLIWQQLKNIPNYEVMDEGRVYGGGLHKIEPKELGNIRIELP